jgi:hypothetical protein
MTPGEKFAAPSVAASAFDFFPLKSSPPMPSVKLYRLTLELLLL